MSFCHYFDQGRRSCPGASCHIDKISVLVTFQRRVGAMRNLQLERKTLESQFYIDLLGIESKYWSQLREPLYRQV